MEEKLEKFLDRAILEMRQQIDHCKTEIAEKEHIIREFGLLDYYSSIPDDICSAIGAADYNAVMNSEDQKLEKLNNESTTAQLDTFLNSFKTTKKSLEEFSEYLRREIEKYENEYIKEYHNSNQDGIDFTSLQTSIHKLQAEIHQANEQQEPKSIITAKLSECFKIHKEVTECQLEAEQIKKELAFVRHLPSNIPEALKKLNDLKKKYQEISNEFSKKVAK